jgi:hypothetical protein
MPSSAAELRYCLLYVCRRAAAAGSMPEALELRSRCSQLEEQVEQQQKIIRYLQGQQGGAGRVSRMTRQQWLSLSSS